MPVGYKSIEISGEVTKQLTAKGSKSEREATFLQTDSGRYLLRRQGANPFFDPVVEKLVGKRIAVKGILTEYTLIMSEWHVLEKHNS